MTDIDKLKLVREVFPATENKVYVNTGSVGALSTIAAAAMREANDLNVGEGRASYKNFERMFKTRMQYREAFARLTNAHPDEIAITHNTTEGMNIVSHGLSWQPGDEIILTDCEHEGGILPAYVIKQRHNLTLRVVTLKPGDDYVAKLEAAITPRTRLMIYSHILWNTGVRLPLAEIVAMGHRHNVLSLVDAAQSTGSIPLNLPASGVDFYAMPGQKWLCGPTGKGALYIRRDRLSLVRPTFAGFLTLEQPGMYNSTGDFVAADSARRFENSTDHGPSTYAMVQYMHWVEENLGWEWVYNRIEQIASYTYDALNALDGVTIFTPSGAQSGLVTFNLEGYDPSRVMAKLMQEDIIIRYLPHNPYAARVSAHFYNTEEDIDKLVDGLKRIQQMKPEELPTFEFNMGDDD